MKTLTKTEIKEIRQAYENGEDQTSIANRYANAGFVSFRGGKINNTTISYIITKKKIRKTYTKKQDQTTVATKNSTLLETLVNSLTSTEKIKLITELSR